MTRLPITGEVDTTTLSDSIAAVEGRCANAAVELQAGLVSATSRIDALYSLTSAMAEELQAIKAKK